MLIVNETLPEWDGTIPRTSGLVLLVRQLRTGDTVSEWMTPFFAVTEHMFSTLNGKEVVSGHIEWGNVSSGTIGVSGGGFAAEYTIIKAHIDTNNTIG